jgi:hypothetical protein
MLTHPAMLEKKSGTEASGCIVTWAFDGAQADPANTPTTRRLLPKINPGIVPSLCVVRSITWFAVG